MLVEAGGVWSFVGRQVMVLLINIFAALATGGAVVAGQYLGQKNKEQACKSTTQLMWSMGFISIVITAFVYACKYWVLAWGVRTD